jgi:hypothetical protein
VGARAGLDKVEKRKFLTILGLELRLLGRPARSQSLYRLRYPGSLIVIDECKNVELAVVKNFIVDCAHEKQNNKYNRTQHGANI